MTVSHTRRTQRTRQGGRTIARPLQTASAQTAGAVLVDLEPHRALSVEGGSRLAGGHFGKVEVERTRVADRRAGGEADSAAGSDCQRLGGTSAGVALIAGHGLRGDVGHGAVGLEVLGLANGLPVCRLDTVVDGAREGVFSEAGVSITPSWSGLDMATHSGPGRWPQPEAQWKC